VTVFQNKQRNREWRYDFLMQGRRYHGACIMPTGAPAASKREALDAEAAVRSAARANQKAGRSIARPGTYTFGQAVLARIRRQVGISTLHLANLRLYGRELLAFFGADTPIAEISQSEVDAYRTMAAARPVMVWRGGPNSRDTAPAKTGDGARARSPASINHRLDFLRSVFTQAHRTRDTVTRKPMLEHPPHVEPVPQPRRQPRPMPDAELYARLESAPPWVRETGELVRHFGLRRAEALSVDLSHIDLGLRGLRFSGNTSKSGRDEFAMPLPGGWEILQRLAKQARRRGQTRLITWPGPAHMADFLAGRPVPRDCWRPLKSIRRAWRTTVATAEIEHPHRLHDVRARYITEVGKINRGVAKDAARHADPATTERYIAVAVSEVAAVLKGVPRPQKPPLRRAGGND
jgi:integrase